VVITGGVYAGDPNKGEQALQPLRQFAEPLGEITGQLPYRMVQSAFDPFFPNTGVVHSYWKSVYANELSDDVIDILADLGKNRSSSYTLINVPHFGGAVRRVKPTDTAFWTRDASFMLSLDGNWTDPSEREQHISWVRQAWDRLYPHSTGAVYLNFMGEETENAEALVRSAFGDNYDRLVELKTKYDPTNLFRMNQNIKPRA
jgi:FAD/FMN-containing dehydrogenase